MTLGQILNNPDELLRRRVDNFQKNGLSLEVVVCYYSENRPDELKRLFDWFLPVDLELDGSLKGKIVKYRDDGWYVNNDGKFSVLNNTVENTMAKDLKRLYSTFQTTDDIARFMVHLYYEFHYVSDKELKRKFTERYEFLMNDLQNLCVEGRKIRHEHLSELKILSARKGKLGQCRKGNGEFNVQPQGYRCGGFDSAIAWLAESEC